MSIEVYEWSEDSIRKKRLSDSPDFRTLTTKLPNLSFNGWSLAHAVVKADYLDRRNLAMPGLGFLLQASNLIEFGASTLELTPGASKALNDVSLSSLSARVGQGLAILYGHSLGFRFAAHLRAHVESLPAGSPGTVHKSEAMADFLFASSHKTVLIEAKGSFTQRENDPTHIKSVLKKALKKQVDPWMSYLQPTPENGYVVYSCLRENSWVPSAMFVVDPEGEDDKVSDVPFSIEQVLRENYGAWLRAMGLTDTAKRLLQPSADLGEPVEQQFDLAEFDGRVFAYLGGAHILHHHFSGLSTPIIGVDLEVLQAISSAIQTKDTALQDLLAKLPAYGVVSEGVASVFPDGTILGPISSRLARTVTVLL